jgi:hypothetical protein
VKSSKSRDNPARRAKPEVRLIEAIVIATESNSSDLLPPAHAQSLELARSY